MTLPHANHRLAAIALAGCITFLSVSCTVVPGADGPPLRLFVLSPKSTYEPDMPHTDWQIGIELPVADAGINTARIALRHNPLSLEYFERANWVDVAPRMVQTLLIESFENSGKAKAAARASGALRTDYMLLSDLREFQAEYGDSPPHARVRLNLKLVKMPERIIVGAVNIERREPATGARLNDVVEAFDEALGKVMRRAVDWTLRSLPPREAAAGRG